MEQSVESNFFDKFKAMASLTLPAYFTNISDFFLKGFSENPVNLDMKI